MKRLWMAMVCVALLCGCARRETNTPRPAESSQPSSEQEAVPEKQPEEPEEDLAAVCAALCYDITRDRIYLISVRETDDTAVTLDVSPDDPAAIAHWRFAERYQWAPATEVDWETQAEETGVLVTLADGDSRATLQCRETGEVIRWRQGSEGYRYARVTAIEGEESSAFARELLSPAESLMDRQVWRQTVSRTFAPASRMAETVARAYRGLPDWVSWKPADIQADHVEVYDTWEGERRQICATMYFRLQLPGDEVPVYWSMGDGVGEADPEGWRIWTAATMRLERDEADLWRVVERSISGTVVELPMSMKTATLEELVEALYLSGGLTNEHRLPAAILALPEEELARLPDLLEQMEELDIKLLCGALGRCVKRGDGGQWTLETLQPVMGAYDLYLDA